jgi:outer membrane protein OmpA-like peptidoglycan-associated protein
MTLTKPFITLGLTATLLAGCVSPIPPATEENRRTQTGAVTGALIGGALGATANGDDRLAKTVIGAGVGALIGGAIGSALDAQAAELRNSIGDDRVGITNTGSALIVNLPQDILFATGSATLRGDLTQDLRAVARSLLNYPNTTVQVIGHTDNVGSAAMNQDLSQRRAASVSSILQSNGVPGGRIVAFGRGEDQPIASNLSEAGRAQNRRVEIIIRPN